MKKRLSIVFCILVFLIVVPGCQSQDPKLQDSPSLSPQRTEELHKLALTFTEYVSSGDIDAAMAMMDETMTSAIDGKLGETWAQLIESSGSFIETQSYIGVPADAYEALEMTLVFEDAKMIQRVVFNKDNQISGLFYRNGEVAPLSSATLPKNVQESEVTVDAGEGYPLSGRLTMPKNSTPSAAIVLVHGSGPSDMNETIGANTPFQDLSYSLAEKGIAVLRYDKRSYTYQDELAKDTDSITLEDEVIADARAAVEVLRSNEEINPNSIYLAGHSMSGGLLSYINSDKQQCAGYIIMAGTPRNLWELIAEQNLLLADEEDQSGNHKSAEEILSIVEQETLKGNNLSELKSDETVFGVQAAYLQEFDKIDALALHTRDKLPVLVLQGEKDRQVYLSDFELWKEGLAQHPSSTFISYPTLNHLFGEYLGQPVPFSQMISIEYAQRTPVSDDVIHDISSWIDNLSQRD